MKASLLPVVVQRLTAGLAVVGAEVSPASRSGSPPSDAFGQLPVFFEITTPLTEPEVLYAIKTTLGLNNLAIVSAGKDSVRAGHISEGRATKPVEPPDLRDPHRTDAP